jgi:8-oxo-dGTP pyrophosphatase MutT (NUDIX family)
MRFVDGNNGWPEALLNPDLKALESIIRALELGSRNDEVTIAGDAEANWQRFRSLFQHIEAAGGVVLNDAGAWLMIYRLGKWDLPKGKLESFEQPEEAAVREVSEECGIPEPELLHHLIDTYHIYTQHTERVLKRTYWYKMRSHGKHSPTPQTVEGITEVKWVKTMQVAELAAQSYGSIRTVIEKAMGKTED